jgi:hypothetical protein
MKGGDLVATKEQSSDKQQVRNTSNGPRYVQVDPKQAAIAIMPGMAIPVTKELLACADVARLLRTKHLRLETVPTKAPDKKGGEG